MPKVLFNDLSYSFNYDNPFPEDNNKSKLNILKKLIKQKLSIDFDYIDKDIKYYELNPGIQQLYGDDTKEKNITELSLIDDIKTVVKQIPELKYFNTWVSQYSYNTNEVVVGGEQATDEEEDEEQQNDNNNEEDIVKQVEDKLLPEETHWESIIPIQASKFDYSKTNGLTNYDITSEKPLSYEEIRKLSVNIARSKLKSTIEKSEQVITLEREKRKQLMNNIQKYRNINAIGVMVEDNIQDMNLSQLEHTLNHCEKLYQSQKLKEVIKRGANFGSLIAGTVFPDGIKIGKTKKVKIKGAAKTIIENIFDTQSTIGVAFQNIVDKHNWNITDEAVLMLSMGEMFISSIKVEDTAKQEEQNNNTPIGFKQNYTTPITNAKIAIDNDKKDIKEEHIDKKLDSENVLEEYYDEEEEEEYEDEEQQMIKQLCCS